VATRDAGISKNGEQKDSFARGIELRAKQTLFAEGARGSLSEEVMSRFNLREKADVQTYGLGLKEVWEIPEAQCKPGFVQHTLGWPLQSGPFDKTFGGSFLYHMAPNLVRNKYFLMLLKFCLSF
jgi:electron-transferring-flavoprotein dehydrogenase